MQAQYMYEKCPKHQMNDIVLFCLSGNCKEPLCKDCCKLHVTWHNQQGTMAELDTVDNVRQQLLNDVHSMKIRFEEERAILHHFSDGEHSELIKSIHHKVERVKKTLLQVVTDYCLKLEDQIKQKLVQHRSAHPGEKKDLHNKLNLIINDLDTQEKALLTPKYIRACLVVITEERNHDLEGLQAEIDASLKHYLANLFDVFIHEDRLQKIVQSVHEYVEIHQANLQEEIDIYTKKIRDGKRVFGVEPNAIPNSAINRNQSQTNSGPFKQSIYDQGRVGQRSPQVGATYQQPPIVQTSQYYGGNTGNTGNIGNTGNTGGISNPYGTTGNYQNTKNYESRIQSNNEKLKQYYG